MLKTFVLMNKNAFVNGAERQSLKLHYSYLVLSGSVYLFRAAIYELLIVLHKDQVVTKF